MSGFEGGIALGQGDIAGAEYCLALAKFFSGDGALFLQFAKCRDELDFLVLCGL